MESVWLASARAVTWNTPGSSSPAILYMFGTMSSRPWEADGTVEIVYLDEVEDYTVHAEFKRAGNTVLTLTSPDGEKTEYDLSIERDTYTVNQIP